MTQNFPEIINNKLEFLEFSPTGLDVLNNISKLIKQYNGGLLVIDYGYEKKDV